jgi:hypothetical protein
MPKPLSISSDQLLSRVGWEDAMVVEVRGDAVTKREKKENSEYSQMRKVSGNRKFL